MRAGAGPGRPSGACVAQESEVLLQPGHKRKNIVSHNHTGLKMYPNWRLSGACLARRRARCCCSRGTSGTTSSSTTTPASRCIPTGA